MTSVVQTHYRDVGFFRAKKPVPSSVEFPRCKEVLAWRDHFLEAYQAGNHLYLATTTYISPSKIPLTPYMAARNLREFYVALLRCTIHPHNFNRLSFRSLQPTMLAFLDTPGSKRKHTNSPALLPKYASDDLHHHSILIVRPEIVGKFDDLCSYPHLRDQVASLKSKAYIKTFDIRRIDPEPESIAKIVDYATYYARTHRQTLEHTDIILPIPDAEFRQKRPARPT